MYLPINQRGVSQILLPLFLVAAITLTVYLAQQQTDITPSAQVATEAPVGCEKVTPKNRTVKYKNCKSASEPCGDETKFLRSDREEDFRDDFKFDNKIVKDYPLKEVVWDFGGWKLYGTRGSREVDGDRLTISSSRLDSPDGKKSYKETDDDRIEGGNKIEYGSGIVVEYAYTKVGINHQGIESYLGEKSILYDESKSYAFIPKDPNSNVKCNGASTTGSKATGAACAKPSDCQSGSCINEKCSATGIKAGGAACTKAVECQSGTCDNGKCAGGAAATGKACDENKDCASNICTASKCVAKTSTTNNTTNNTTTNRTNTTNNTTTNGTNTTTPPANTTNNTTTTATPTPAGTVPTSLTKAEITGFSNSYKALAGRLGTASNSGNLKVVSTIAGTELDSIVSQLPTCPDDASVGKCLDDKFRTRFDFAKTAARLTAFYAIFNNVSGLCVKSDFGLNPLITAASTTNTNGRVNLCTEPTAAGKIWRIFAAGKFEPVLASDTRWPANPTCATLPQDVATHYRNAEKLFNTQSGFTENTLCDGRTSVAPEGTNSPAL